MLRRVIRKYVFFKTHFLQNLTANNIFGKSKNVYAYSEDKVLIRKYNSMAEAVADGYTASYIRDCCNGKIKLYKNLFWSYREVC